MFCIDGLKGLWLGEPERGEAIAVEKERKSDKEGSRTG